MVVLLFRHSFSLKACWRVVEDAAKPVSFNITEAPDQTPLRRSP
jgi:hypothetical protein